MRGFLSWSAQDDADGWVMDRSGFFQFQSVSRTGRTVGFYGVTDYSAHGCTDSRGSGMGNGVGWGRGVAMGGVSVCVFLQLDVPTVLCSHKSIFRQLYVRTALCSAPCSHGVYVPTALFLQRSIFPQLYVPQFYVPRSLYS